VWGINGRKKKYARVMGRVREVLTRELGRKKEGQSIVLSSSLKNKEITSERRAAVSPEGVWGDREEV